MEVRAKYDTNLYSAYREFGKITQAPLNLDDVCFMLKFGVTKFSVLQT